MMKQDRRDPEQFGRLLKTAIRKVALLDDKNISLVQDELGYALGRETGGAAIQFWERGHIPAKPGDVEALNHELLKRNGLSQREAIQLLHYAGLQGEGKSSAQTFIAGPPITRPDLFFGREYELKRLFGLWGQANLPMQNAAVIGPRGSGKTSLLFYLKTITTTPRAHLRPEQRTDWLPDPDQYQWIYVDFRIPRLGSRRELLRYLLTGLELPVPQPCNLEGFVEVMRNELASPTIILLDEIDVALERYNNLDDAFWDGLRALASTQVKGKLAFVLSSREFPSSLARRNHRSSDFFSIFAYLARLGPLTEPEARSLIDSAPVPFSTADIDWILAESKGWPFLIQILCRERLFSLDEASAESHWREEGLRQLELYQHLLAK
jgi:hypothetical protein